MFRKWNMWSGVGDASGQRSQRPSWNRNKSRRRLSLLGMTAMPLSEVKARLSEIAEEVNRTHERVHVTRNGREYVVLLSAEDLESLEATIELLRDNSAMVRVREADVAATADDLTTAEGMAKLMAERRVREPRGR